MHAREHGREFGEEDEVHATRQGEVGVAAAQLPYGVMDGEEGRGAGRLHRQRRAAQVEQVRQSSGGHAEHAAGERVGAQPGGIRLELAVQIVGADDPGEHGGVRPGEPVGRLAGAFQRLPGDLEQQAVLGVHRRGLGRGEAEEGGVERVDALQQRGSRVLPAFGGAGVRVGGRRTAGFAVGDRHERHRFGLPQDVPERLGRVGSAGEPARHPDDRDRLMGVRHISSPRLRAVMCAEGVFIHGFICYV